jgi:hypothetical protein
MFWQRVEIDVLVSINDVLQLKGRPFITVIGRYYPIKANILRIVLCRCVACPIGTQCPGNDNGYYCMPGYYQPSAGQTSCNACASGSYQPTRGQPSCLQCSAGRYGTSAASNSVAACSACPAGNFQPYEGQSSCSYPCAAGTYSSSGTYILYIYLLTRCSANRN